MIKRKRDQNQRDDLEARQRVEKRFAGGARLWRRFQFLALYVVLLIVYFVILINPAFVSVFGTIETVPQTTYHTFGPNGTTQSITLPAWDRVVLWPFWVVVSAILVGLFFASALSLMIAVIREVDLEMLRLQVRLEMGDREKALSENVALAKPKRSVLLSADGELIAEEEPQFQTRTHHSNRRG